MWLTMVLLHSFVQNWLVCEFELKGVGDCGLVYVKFHISSPWGALAFDIEYENRWSRDLGTSNLPLASKGDNGNLQNCWCLDCCFLGISIFLELAMLKIQMIFNK